MGMVGMREVEFEEEKVRGGGRELWLRLKKRKKE